MDDRITRLENNARQDMKDINDKLTDIQDSITVLKTKQNIGGWIFNFMGTAIIALVSGFLGGSFHK